MFRSLPRLLPLLIVLGCLVSPQVAGASNLLNNPGFESVCPGANCGWTFAADDVFYDTVPGSPHSGSATVTLGANANHFAKASQCVDVSEQKFDASAWYQMDDAAEAELDVEFFDQPGCAGQSSSSSNTSGMVSGGWMQLALTSVGGTGIKSAVVNLFVEAIAFNVASAANFDDVSLAPSAVTAVTFRSLTATRSSAGTLVRWRTASEVEVAGFNVYRVEHGRRVRVNRHLIAAKARGGASYRLLDRGHRGATYRVEVVNLDGTRQWRTVR